MLGPVTLPSGGAAAILAAAALVALPRLGAAQQPAATAAALDSALPAAWRVGVFAGGAHRSPVTGNLGVTPGRDHFFLGAQALTPVLRAGPIRLSYGAQLLPLVLLRGRAAPAGYRGPLGPDGQLPGRALAYAVGLSPFGLELATPLARRAALFGRTAAGGLVFSRPYPVPEAQRANFTLEYGGGLLLRVGAGRWVEVGYKHHHLSNAYTARQNPGVDGNVFYAGYEHAIRAPR